MENREKSETTNPIPEKKLSASDVGREFVRHYYTILFEKPNELRRLYSNDSLFVHNSDEVVGSRNIGDKIMSLGWRQCKTTILSLDAHDSVSKAIVVQVIGEMSINSAPCRRFVQTFVLVPQTEKKYYVHNDIFRFDGDDGTDRKSINIETDHSVHSQPTTSHDGMSPEQEQDRQRVSVGRQLSPGNAPETATSNQTSPSQWNVPVGRETPARDDNNFGGILSQSEVVYPSTSTSDESRPQIPAQTQQYHMFTEAPSVPPSNVPSTVAIPSSTSPSVGNGSAQVHEVQDQKFSAPAVSSTYASLAKKGLSTMQAQQQQQPQPQRVAVQNVPMMVQATVIRPIQGYGPYVMQGAVPQWNQPVPQQQIVHPQQYQQQMRPMHGGEYPVHDQRHLPAPTGDTGYQITGSSGGRGDGRYEQDEKIVYMKNIPPNMDDSTLLNLLKNATNGEVNIRPRKKFAPSTAIVQLSSVEVARELIEKGQLEFDGITIRVEKFRPKGSYPFDSGNARYMGHPGMFSRDGRGGGMDQHGGYHGDGAGARGKSYMQSSGRRTGGRGGHT